MASPRKTRWVDALIPAFTLEGDTGGETVMNNLVTEADIEGQFNGRATLIRVVGDIIITESAGFPLVDLLLSAGVSQAFVANQVLTDDDFEDMRTIWTALWADDSASSTIAVNRIHVDVRTKRKLSPNMSVQFIASTPSLAGQDSVIAAHFRSLILIA